LGRLRAAPSSLEIKLRFLLTMNMPVKSGAPIHQIMCEHPKAKTVEEFVAVLGQNDFTIVDEYYKDNNSSLYYNAGKIALNYRFVGKIKAVGDNATYLRD